VNLSHLTHVKLSFVSKVLHTSIMYPIKSSGLCFSAFLKCTNKPCKYTSYMHLCMKIHYKFLTYLCGLHFSYGREISSLTLKAEHALRVHDKIVFSWIYVHNWQDVKKEGKNYILRTFYIFPVYSPCRCASVLSSAIPRIRTTEVQQIHTM
jgi:hypothetical protein